MPGELHLIVSSWSERHVETRERWRKSNAATHQRKEEQKLPGTLFYSAHTTELDWAVSPGTKS